MARKEALRPKLEPPGTAREHLNLVAESVAHELQPALKLKGVIDDHGLLIGMHAEAVVRRLIRRIVYPLKVSTGSVIDFPHGRWKQIDAIIWSAYPAPAIYESDDFALVPRSNAFGLIEIKQSDYGDAIADLEKFPEIPRALAAEPFCCMPPVDPVCHLRCDHRFAGLGVVAALLKRKPPRRLQKLIDAGCAVAIFRPDGTVRHEDMLTLINFLHFVKWRHQMHMNRTPYVSLPVK